MSTLPSPETARRDEHLVYLGLGSNLGDGPAQLHRALELLGRRGCRVLRVSHFYRTEPVPPAPKEPWFTNCVAEAETVFSPRALLRTAKAIESVMGRQDVARGAPRPIDIDILFYEESVVNLPRLKIPHPHLGERRFVLVPLKELAPKLRHPVTGKAVSPLLRETRDKSKVTRLQT